MKVAKRLECGQLAAAFERTRPSDGLNCATACRGFGKGLALTKAAAS
jgi:hypothetical protein